MLRFLVRLRRWENWAKAAGFITIFLSIIVCSFLWAISNPPSPSSGPIAQRNHAAPHAEQQAADTDPRGTKAVPLVVEVVPPKEGTPEAERYEEERQQKAANERGLTVATWVLTFATILLFTIAGVQAAFFWVQLQIMREGMRDATIAAYAARDGAIAAKDQAQAIILAERPYIVFKITKRGLAFVQNAMIIPDTETNGRLHFEIINAGRTPAMLEEFKETYPIIEGRIDAPVPLDPMKDRGTLLPVGTISTANSPYSRATNLFDEENVPKIRKMLDPRAWQDRRIFCQGFIRYSDAFGNLYITGFLMAFSPSHGAWALRGGKQYNYSRQEKREDIPPHPGYPDEG